MTSLSFVGRNSLISITLVKELKIAESNVARNEGKPDGHP